MTTAITQTYQHFDDDTLAFVTRSLLVISSKVYERKYAPLKMANGDIVPIVVDSELEWADTVEIEEYDAFGMNALIADYSKGGPRVGTLVRRAQYPIKTHGNHAGWSWEEINKAKAFNRPLQERRLMATREAYDKYLNYTGWNGDLSANIPGIFTTSMQRAIASVPINATQTADAVLSSLGAYVAGLVSSTNEIAQPKKIVLPVTQQHYLFNTRRSLQSDLTIGEAFLDAQKELGFITEIIGDNNLQGKGTGGTDCMLIVPDDEEVINYNIPMPYTILPEQQQNLEIVTHTVGRVSGIHCLKPMECLIVEGI